MDTVYHCSWWLSVFDILTFKINEWMWGVYDDYTILPTNKKNKHLIYKVKIIFKNIAYNYNMSTLN